MQQKDFVNLIDLKSEYKEYIRFDKGKSSIYTTYAQWDAHIETVLLGFKASTEMYNFRRYCINMIRLREDRSSIMWSYISLAFPLIMMFSTEKDRIGWTGIFLMLMSMAFLCFVIWSAERRAREKHFYEDIFRIIEHIESHS